MIKVLRPRPTVFYWWLTVVLFWPTVVWSWKPVIWSWLMVILWWAIIKLNLKVHRTWMPSKFSNSLSLDYIPGDQMINLGPYNCWSLRGPTWSLYLWPIRDQWLWNFQNPSMDCQDIPPPLVFVYLYPKCISCSGEPRGSSKGVQTVTKCARVRQFRHGR